MKWLVLYIIAGVTTYGVCWLRLYRALGEPPPRRSPGQTFLLVMCWPRMWWLLLRLKFRQKGSPT